MYMVAPVGEAAEHVPGRWLSLVAVVACGAVFLLGLFPGGVVAVANASTMFVK